MGIIKVDRPCETCGKMRKFKYSEGLDKVYNYKPICKSCTLTERNKRQNFSVRKYPIVDKFEVIDTAEKAYIYGFLWADGCLVEQKRKRIANIKSVSVCINSKDNCILDFLVKQMGGSWNQVSVYDKRTDKEYDSSRWNLYSKEVHDNIMALGFREHSNAVSDELFSHFLRGLIDGDGSIRYRESHGIGIKITSDAEQDWSFVTDRITNPYHIGVYEGKNGNKSSDLNINGDKAEFLRYIYKDSTFHLQRKYERIKDAI